MEAMAGIGVFTVIIGLVALITFFVMAIALNNISKAARNINKVVTAWQRETGIGVIFTCKNCKKTYEGRQATCPHCGDPKTYV